MDNVVKPYLARFDEMKACRLNYDTFWQEVADYSLPKRDFTTTRTQGTKRNQRLYDSTAIHATEQLAGGLHGMLTPPSGKWLFLRIKNAKETTEARRWLDDTANFLFDVFSSPESSFATAAFEYYLDLVAFGNAAMSVTFRQGRIHFNTENLANVYVSENDYGRVDSVYLYRKMKPIQIIRKFGDAAHAKVKEAYEKGLKVEIEVLHVIEPRDEHYGRGAIKEKKPIKSCFIDITNQHMMLEEGFDDFPFMYARWSKRAGETYGYGCGMAALHEVKMLNSEVEVMLRAANKNVDPPVLSPAEGLILPMRIDPGAINYYDPSLPEPKFWNNGFQPNYLDAQIERQRALVQKMYYVDWLNLPQVDRMTTVEVNRRTQESLRQLSPMLSRLAGEFLSPLINRTIALALDNNLIPRPPVSAQGREFAIEYTSPIAIAQKSIQAETVLQGLTIGAQLAQFDQSVPMNINSTKIFRDVVLNTFAWPVDYLNDEEDVEEMKQVQQQQAQMAQQAAVAESYAKTAKDAAGAYSEVGGAL